MITLDKCKTRREAKRRAPDCVVFVKTPYGYLAFRTQYDYDVWKSQK